jgi:hypothetical protein
MLSEPIPAGVDVTPTIIVGGIDWRFADPCADATAIRPAACGLASPAA